MKTTPSSEYVILGSLMSGPKHGYEILQFIDSTLVSAWRISTSQLYTLLKKLEEKGLLESTMEQQETRPSKRVFSLTEKGEQIFLYWLKEPVARGRDFRMEFIAKLFFFHFLALKGSLELIDSQIQVMENLKAQMESREKNDPDRFNRLIYGFKIKNINNLLEWLKEQGRPFMEKEVEGSRNQG